MRDSPLQYVVFLMAPIFKNYVATSKLMVTLCVGMVCAGCSTSIVERELSIPAAEHDELQQNYRIVPNDAIRVLVYQEPDMLTEQQVAQDGTITFPLIGNVKVSGLTLDEAAAAVANRLKQGFMVDPQVSVGIVAYAPRTYTILGQVGGAGNV